MADERSLNYEINLGAAKAADDVENLKDEIGEVVDNLDEAESKSKGFTSALDRAGKIGGGAVDGVGKSLEKNFGGAVDRANKRSTVFIKNLVTGAKNIGNAFLHPVQTIRKHLVDAMSEAEDETHGLESRAEETGRAIDKMGDAGKNAGDAIKRAVTAGIKAFVGIEAIKKATELIKNFVSTSLSAAQAAEGAEARFSALFENTDAAQWADNYAEATKTAISNVQTWMSDNKAFLDYLGYSQQEASNLSKIVTGLGDDIAEAFHVDESSVMSALQDAFGGDFKALHSIGINIDESQLKATAKRFYEELGDKDFKKDLDKLTEAQYASVALAAILAETKELQGKAIQEADTLTGANKSLRETWESFLEEIGKVFSPTVIDILNTLSTAIQENTPELIKAAKWVAEKVEDSIPYIRGIAEGLASWIVSKTEESNNAERVNTYMTTGQLPEMTPEQSESYGSYVSDEERKMRKFDESWLGQLKSALNFGYDYSSRLPEVGDDGSSGGIDKELWQRHTEDRWLVNAWDWATNQWNKIFGESDGPFNVKDAYTSLGSDTVAGILERSVGGVGPTFGDLQESMKDVGYSAIDLEAGLSRLAEESESLVDSMIEQNNRLRNLTLPSSVPGNARGTGNFPGGWTKIHEEGDELAFLPQGTAIIPADKTNQIIDGKRSVNVQFSPQINIQVPANADESTKQDLVRLFREEARRLFVEMQNDEFNRLAVQNAYARG